MADWTNECPYNGPEHNFKPLRELITREGRIRVAVCAKCGALR